MSAGLVLLRHGQTENPDGLVYGRLPGFGLSTVGEQQAAAAAAELAAERIGVVVSSPLDRARQTATAVARGVPVESDERLIEVATADEGAPFVPDPSWRGDTTEITLLSPRPFPAALETTDDVRRRMRAAAADALARTPPDSLAVLVSHQVPLALLARSLGITARVAPHVLEGEVITLRRTPTGWIATSADRREPVPLLADLTSLLTP